MNRETVAQIKAGTLSNLHDLWLWDVAERQRLQRAAEAGGYGFDTREYARPFPGCSVVQVNPARVAGNSRLGAAAVIAAALLGGVGIGGAAGGAIAALAGSLGKSPAAAAAKPAEPQEFEVTFEADGRRLEVNRQ